MIKLIEEIKTNISPDDVFKTNTTNFSFYNIFLDDKSLGKVTEKEYYKFEKGLEGKVVKMTADEYIKLCSDKVFGKSVDYIMNGRHKGTILKYAEDMRNGDKFPMPYINLSEKHGKGQEGLHRAAAFKEVFGPDAKFNVLVVMDANPSEEEMWEYAERKWGKLANSFMHYLRVIAGKESDD